MRVPISLATIMSLVLSVRGAAVPDPQRTSDSVTVNTTSDGQPLCGGFSWWNNDHWQEEQLWETRQCLKFYHNVGRVNVADWGKCELCFFYPSSDCTGHNTLTVDNQHGWVDTHGDVWSYYCFLKG